MTADLREAVLHSIMGADTGVVSFGRQHGQAPLSIDRHVMGQVIDRVLAAIREHAGGDAIETAAKALGHGYWDELPETATYMQRKSARGHWADRDEIRADVRSIAPILIASARAAALEEAAVCADQWSKSPIVAAAAKVMSEQDLQAAQATAAGIARAIRALIGSAGR